jgi:hypothetical protein
VSDEALRIGLITGIFDPVIEEALSIASTR